WFDRLPRNSINTFEQMAKMFLGKYFPPSMVTKLRNKITNFRQRPDESLFVAWERYKLSIDRCTNHNMLPVTQIDTFYNRLTVRHRDTINDAAALKAKMAEIKKNPMRVLQVNQQVKAVTPNYETCGGPHSFSDCPAPLATLRTYMLQQPIKELKICKVSIDEPPEVEIKDFPSPSRIRIFGRSDKLPVIIAKDLSVEEKIALITVLKSHKRAIAWKLSDIKGIDPEFYTHKILMEEDFEPAVQDRRRVNPKIHNVIKNEVLKLLDAELIYPISDSPWVSLLHCLPKKGGFTVVENEENELILTRLVTGWRVCIDYRKLNKATRNDHFPVPFMDQMLERLAGNEYYCFLDGFLSYFEKDQEKTTFTCLYGTFA
nr:reverse transcriptase domain-containing protein [Tanacetum cinerariifolium]